MALSVIGAGFGRTGTMSMKMALEQLGFGPCHHMEEVLSNPPQTPLWLAAANGEAVDWDVVFDGYTSTVDWPGAHYWRELSEAYPEAKVILTTRPADRWWASISTTILKLLDSMDEVEDPQMRQWLSLPYKIVTEQTLGGDSSEASALAAFEQRERDVRAAIAPDRLLVFNVAEGWEPLCNFLGCEIPDNEFPRSNSKDEFWEHFT
ncbi:sulfotransferase family protein [Parasphingopyxis marina]|uniref:Sulfotransferase family protein n=1 Tax=Parasphingopyxis marina TaxID=2761622 RepID=A0A842HV58_9SPHN|nr:sulfotransferase family protein [Parasphingopyxis marina]MBC2776805.1 sulfotransferase family protein [Parasphingopyxis marina]